MYGVWPLPLPLRSRFVAVVQPLASKMAAAWRLVLVVLVCAAAAAQGEYLKIAARP